MQRSTIGNRVVVPKPIDARANSTELLESLGYKVLRTPTRRHPKGATLYRRAGGRKGGYCPVTN